MSFKLAEAAAKSWRHSNGHKQLPKLILGRNRRSQTARSTRCGLMPSVIKIRRKLQNRQLSHTNSEACSDDIDAHPPESRQLGGSGGGVSYGVRGTFHSIRGLVSGPGLTCFLRWSVFVFFGCSISRQPRDRTREGSTGTNLAVIDFFRTCVTTIPFTVG
jgi:hypothetical protein